MSYSLPEPRFLSSEYIEREVEYHLTFANLMPKEPAPIDIEALLEVHLEVHLDQYAELDKPILGETSLLPNGRPQVLINRDLTTDADNDLSPLSVKGRWRATLGHEAGHVIFHRTDLEAAALQPSLFDSDSSLASLPRTQPCLKRDFARVGGVNRREYQANLAMGALLMPRPVFVPAARTLICSLTPPLDPPLLQAVVPRLAALFEVSQTAVRIRLEHLKLDRGGEHGKGFL